MIKRKVLVVDDRLDFAEGIARQLELYGHQAIATTTVREALDTLDNDPSIGLIVSDVRMPPASTDSIYVASSGTDSRRFRWY